MKASILDLRRHMKQILAALDKNERITLTYRGREKATIVPSGAENSTDLRSHPAFGLWADRSEGSDAGKMVRQIREGRVDAI